MNAQAWHEGCCVYVTGGIVNNGGITQYRIRIQITVYDSDDQMLGEGRTPCTPNFLAYGQPPCRFSIQLHGFDDLQQVYSYTYRIISQDVP